MRKGRIVGDVFRYIIGSFIILISLGSLLSKNSIVSGIFLFICGLTTMPFIFRLLGKTKIPRGLLIAMAITIPIISFFISAFTTPIDENEDRISSIRTVLNLNLKKTNKEKEFEINRIDESDKYSIILHIKYSKAYDYNAVGHYSINYIEKIKNNTYNKYINSNINDYTINFYKDGFLTYTITYNNDDQTVVNQINILNTSTNESTVYTKENDQSYISEINEQKRANTEEQEKIKKQKQEEETQRKAQENRKKDTKVIHNVGETVSCEDFDVTVNSFQIKKYGTYINSFEYISDPEWVGVIMTVTNTSSDTHTFYSSKTKLQNSTGEIIGQSILSYNIWGAEMLNSPTLIAGGTKTGYIDFANTNQDNNNLILRVMCDDYIFSDDVIYQYSLK